jgi:hypothetical protein
VTRGSITQKLNVNKLIERKKILTLSKKKNFRKKIKKIIASEEYNRNFITPFAKVGPAYKIEIFLAFADRDKVKIPIKLYMRRNSTASFFEYKYKK